MRVFGDKSASIKLNDIGLQKLDMASPKILTDALKEAGLQFLTWCNAGSSKEGATPPIRFGVLRGSSSVFVGSDKVADYQQNLRSGVKTPAQTYTGVPYSLTVVWNTDYAKKMHEGVYNLGPFSRQSGNAGPKWLEKHLKADKDMISEVFAEGIKRRIDNL